MEKNGLPEDYYMLHDDLSFRIHDSSVEEITILTKTYSLENGLTIGTSFNEIVNIFGSNYTRKDIAGCNRYFMPTTQPFS